MTIHLISFASILHKQASLRNSHEAILSHDITDDGSESSMIPDAPKKD